MHYLVIVIYADQYRAAEIIATVQRSRPNNALPLGFPISITNDHQGNLHLNQSQEIPVSGLSPTDLSMAIAGPLVRVLMKQATADDRADCVAFLHALGVSEWFLKQLHLTLTADRSAIMLMVRHPESDDTLMALSKFDGIMLQTILADDAEQQLRLSVA